ncbi:MAG TPA: ATP-binding protein [Vicinamibacterales bacterium]|nr:ATP-binding protein [Vicinamibacterales bacterium]
MSIKAKQVAGVTTLVVVIVAILMGYHLASLARLHLQETVLRSEMVARAVFQRAREVVPPPGVDIHTALREDGGLRAILESGIGYGPNVTYVAIADTRGIAIAHAFRAREGQPLPPQEDLAHLIEGSTLRQLRAVYYSDQTFEFQQPILAGDEQFGSIRVGVSMSLVRRELRQALRAAIGSILAALLISSLVAMALAQWMLRPIHVIQSGLTRLGRGELDVSLDLPGEEFRDLGSSFDAVSAQLSAVRAKPLPSAATDLESVMENLEDAVALFSPSGEVIFTNAAMKALLAEHRDHPAMRQLVEQTLAGRRDCGPVSIRNEPVAGEATEEADVPERLLMTHAIEDSSGRFIGAMLVARNLAYLSHVHSTLNYSRKLAALGRLMAGVAHEVKNPLNAMTIHLELLKQKLQRQAAATEPAAVAVAASRRSPGVSPGEGGAPKPSDITKHVEVIGSEIRRLDEVVMGFLKFARPDELKLQPVRLADLISDVVTTVGPEAEQNRVTVKVECPPVSPEINADPGMLRQALLNLAINACHAMPDGGTLRIACRTTSRRKVEIDVEDTGVGIPPEHLSRIFDLYFTTKKKGSGIGLSMVYRIIQLHDGDVEVQSTPGAGTRFRLIFPQA